MSTDISKYPYAVQKEAANILKFVPKENREMLDFMRLSGDYIHTCIYGQMFLQCNSKEAFEAIKKCAPRANKARFTKSASINDTKKDYKSIFRTSICTPIEAAIVSVEYSQYNENLINYLKQDL